VLITMLAVRRRDPDGRCVRELQCYRENEKRFVEKTGLQTVETVMIEHGVD
jgi:hypothetical protein